MADTWAAFTGMSAPMLVSMKLAASHNRLGNPSSCKGSACLSTAATWRWVELRSDPRRRAVATAQWNFRASETSSCDGDGRVGRVHRRAGRQLCARRVVGADGSSGAASTSTSCFSSLSSSSRSSEDEAEAENEHESENESESESEKQGAQEKTPRTRQLEAHDKGIAATPPPPSTTMTTKTTNATIETPDGDEDDPLLRRVAELASELSKIRVQRAMQCLRRNPDVLRALRAEAELGSSSSSSSAAAAEATAGAQLCVDDTRKVVGNVNGKANGVSEDVDRRIVDVIAFMTDEMKLSQREKANLIAGFPKVLTLDVEAHLRPVFAFLKSPLPQEGAGMSHRAATNTLMAFPHILAMDMETVLRPKVQYLVNDVGMRPRKALHMDLESEIQPRVRFLARECNLGTTAAAALIRRCPRVLCEDLEETMRPALRCFARETLLSPADIAHVSSKAPTVLFQTPEALCARIDFFTQRLGAETTAKIIRKYPAALLLNVGERILPKYNFLAYELGFGKEGTREMINKSPQLVTLDEDNIRSKVDFLLNDLGLSREEAMTTIMRFPPLLTYDLENNLIPTFHFLRDACADIEVRRRRVAESTSAVGTAPQRHPDDSVTLETMLARHPSLLAMSVERKLRPTLSFLSLHYPECPLPTFLKLCTFSLGGNIVPRVRMMQQYEAACDKDNQRDRWAVATVMGISIEKFCRKVGVSRAEYDAEVAACKAEFQSGSFVAAGADALGKRKAKRKAKRAS